MFTHTPPPVRQRMMAMVLLFGLLFAGRANAQERYEMGRAYFETKAIVLGVLGGKTITSALFNYGAAAGFRGTDRLDFGVEVLGAYIEELRHTPNNLDKASVIASTNTRTLTLGGANSTTGNNGLGGSVFVNCHLWQQRRGSLYAGLGLGYFGFERPTPVSCAQGSFSQNADLGLVAKLSDDFRLRINTRLQHLGPVSDQGIFALGGSLALTYMY